MNFKNITLIQNVITTEKDAELIDVKVFILLNKAIVKGREKNNGNFILKIDN